MKLRHVPRPSRQTLIPSSFRSSLHSQTPTQAHRTGILLTQLLAILSAGRSHSTNSSIIMLGIMLAIMLGFMLGFMLQIMLPPMATGFHVMVIACFAIKILEHIRGVASTMILSYRLWPRASHELSKTDIISSLPSHDGTLDPDELCAFCRDKHTEPRVLLCGHIYCKGCLETLIKRNHNRCGLCHRAYYSLHMLRPTARLQKRQRRAKIAVILHFVYYVPNAICFMAVIVSLVAGSDGIYYLPSVFKSQIGRAHV